MNSSPFSQNCFRHSECVHNHTLTLTPTHPLTHSHYTHVRKQAHIHTLLQRTHSHMRTYVHASTLADTHSFTHSLIYTIIFHPFVSDFRKRTKLMNGITTGTAAIIRRSCSRFRVFTTACGRPLQTGIRTEQTAMLEGQD